MVHILLGWWLGSSSVEARVLKSEKGICFSGPVAQQSQLKSHRATLMSYQAT